MKHVIIGTAGHVDHGKTTLIKALTGTDTDRLKEEQERGMTIDLGFAALTLPDGTLAGIVDVPGHERFLKNMLAGAGGVDIVLLVIAADESVMPQTVEHLEILQILDARNGVVALTKADTVDRDWLPVVEQDIREHLAGTFLADAPIVRVDSVRGQGIDALRRALLSAASRSQARDADAPFRMPVDRVFVRPGFGTVVTGTLIAGSVHVGDQAELLPQGTRTRVRGLQSHGKPQSVVVAGTRVAVNLAGVEAAALERGAVVAVPGTMAPTQVFDATVRLLPTAPRALANRARVRVYVGAAEVIGRLQLLGVDAVEPGGHAYAQFRAERSFACARGDRFVMRTYSPMATVGGGIVLDAAPQRHRRHDPAVIEALASRERGTPDDLMSASLQSAPLGAPRRELARALGMSEADAERAARLLTDRGEALELEGGRLIHRAAFATATDRAVRALGAYHEANPLRTGMPKEELRGALGRAADPRAFAALLARWQAEGVAAADATTVRMTRFEVQLNERQQALLQRVAEAYRQEGVNAPSVEEVSAAVGAPPDAVTAMIRVAQSRGQLVRIADGTYLHGDALEHARSIIGAYVREHGSISVSQFRDLTGSSRRYALPVLEYLDSIRYTRRVGDTRVLVEDAPAQ